MISFTDRTLRSLNGTLTPGVLYVVDGSRFLLADEHGIARDAAQFNRPLFSELLLSEIATAPTQSLAALLQKAYDFANPPQPPPPRYPAVGDVDVHGQVLYVRQILVPGNRELRWIGALLADIATNGYATPPEGQSYRFCFSNLTPLSAGDAVLFDIAMGNYAPFAANVRKA